MNLSAKAWPSSEASMVMILDGNPEIGAHVWAEIDDLIIDFFYVDNSRKNTCFPSH